MIKPILIATTLSLSSLCFAHSDKHAQRLIEALELDETRAAQVEETFKDSRAEGKEIRKRFKEERTALRERTRDQLETILTEEEMEKLNQMMEKRRSKFQGRDQDSLM